jgi:hypothetical protein
MGSPPVYEFAATQDSPTDRKNGGIRRCATVIHIRLNLRSRIE